MNLCPLTWWTRLRTAPCRRRGPILSRNARSSLSLVPEAVKEVKRIKYRIYWSLKSSGGGVIINYVDYLILLLFDNSVITCSFESERVFFPFTFSSRCSRRLIIQWPLIFLFLPPASSRHPTPTRGLYTHMCMCLLFIHSCVGTETKDSIFHQAFLSASPHLHECFLRITLRQENHLHSHSHTLLHAALLS